MTRALLVVMVLASSARADLRKADVRSTMKSIVPKISRCYEQAAFRNPEASGVVNTKLTIRSEPRSLTIKVDGFDTHGTLGESREFLACVTKRFEAKQSPIKARGTLSITYPITFQRAPVDNKDTSLVDAAELAVKEQRWTDALAAAEQGLLLTSLDGTFRRRLIEAAGLAACHLDNATKLRDYMALASQEIEDRLAACSRERGGKR